MTDQFNIKYGEYALSFGLAGDGIDLLVLAPGAMEAKGLRQTANIDYSKMGGFSPLSADEVAQAGLENAGAEPSSFRVRKTGFRPSC